MERVTERKPNKFRQSFGTGIGALTGGGGEYFILEFVNDSATYKAGHQEEIIVNYLEMGRDPSCGVRFSEQDATVSRKHAVISKEDGQYVLIQLSQTNPTLLNGRPVNQKWYLKTGDRIQLSKEGPAMNFIVPQNNKTSSLRLTKRLELFGKQAMRPYKTAILSLSVLLLLTISGSAVAISSLSKENKDIKNRMKEYADNYNAYQAQQDSILNGILEENADLKAKYDKVRASIAKASSAPVKPPVDPSNVTPMKPADKNLKDLHNDVYFIQMNSVEISFQGKVQSVPFGASGTGFLTNDGLFITARHVIEPWYYWGEDENDMIFINQIINEGAKVSGSFTALSPSGERFNFTTEQFTVDRSEDKKIQKNGIVLSSAWDSANDWAYLRPGKSGKLVLDKPLSSSLKQATELEILGYPFGFGHTSNKVTPHYGTTTVSRDGLEDGFIFTTTRGFDQGNSGGPVFVNTAEGYKVVGIVSMGVGTAIGKLVPVSALK